MGAVTLSVLASAFAGIAEEMGTLLVRSAYSSNIKERRDCSAALFDTKARMIATVRTPGGGGWGPPSVA
jgi:N-methylhydantoinase B